MTFDDPRALAADVRSLPRPLLLALDVDGVLSPIVSHASQARLSPGVAEMLGTLADLPDIHVAVVSGRSLEGLRQFDLDPAITVVGSYGTEVLGDPPPTLTAGQEDLFRHLVRLARRAADEAGDGAWVELKPTSVVLHVRQAPSTSGAHARDALLRTAAGLEGAYVKPGSSVAELMVRASDKGTAVRLLRSRRRAAAVVFAGDDETDEDGFRALEPDDIGIKVGPGATHASRRLADTDAVREWLHDVAELACAAGPMGSEQ